MNTNKLNFNIVGIFLVYFFCTLAMAQDAGGLTDSVKGKLSTIQTALTAVGGVVVTIALIYVGMKMVFQAAEWKDVAPVFWGAVLIGGASIIGGALIG
jgi:type IV secretion system protein VirB2